MLLAILAVSMPTSWMAVCHEWLGLGAFPDQPVVEYLARATSGLCAAMGGLLVLASADVRRYAAVITLLPLAYLAMGAAIWVYMLGAGRPAVLYVTGDFVSAAALAVAVLVLQAMLRRADRRA